MHLNVNQVDEDWMFAAEKVPVGRPAEEKQMIITITRVLPAGHRLPLP